MKFVHQIFALFLVVAISACSAGGNKWEGDPQLVYKLELKMSEADVRNVMGEPSSITNADMLGQKQEIWIYNGSKRVSLVLQNGKLVNADLGMHNVLEAGAADI